MKGQLVKIYGPRDPGLELKRFEFRTLPPPPKTVQEIWEWICKADERKLEKGAHGATVLHNVT
jgi:hypothetical protein